MRQTSPTTTHQNLFVATSTFLLLLAITTVQVQLGHGISLVSSVVHHHNGRIRLRGWQQNWHSIPRQNNKSVKTITIDEPQLELVEQEDNDQPIITITIKNNELYDSSSHQQQQQQRQQQHYANNVATGMAQMAKEFEQALVASTSMNTNGINNNNVNSNSNRNSHMYDLNVGNLLTACDRLEQAMRQVGFIQSANGISGNVKKIRNVYNHLPSHINRDSLVSIVQHEFATGVHGSNYVNANNKNVNNNNNKDIHHQHRHHQQTHHTLNHSSATMGFLWLGRSINYQHDMFQQMLDHEEETPYHAAQYAFDKALKPHLPWHKQKACQTFMKKLKPLQMPKAELFCRMGGFQEESYFGSPEVQQASKRDLRKVINSWQPMLNHWKQTFMDLDLAQI